MGLKFNKAEFAKLIGKSPRWVTKLISEDGLPIEGGGGKGREVIIDSTQAIEWLVSQAVAKELGHGEGDELPESGTKSDEELRKLRAQRIQEEIKAQKAQGTAIEIEEIKPVLFEVANIFGQQADALGGRIASEFASINAPAIIKSRMLEESRRIRAQTADRIFTFVAEYRGDSGPDSSGTAPESSE